MSFHRRVRSPLEELSVGGASPRRIARKCLFLVAFFARPSTPPRDQTRNHYPALEGTTKQRDHLFFDVGYRNGVGRSAPYELFVQAHQARPNQRIAGRVAKRREAS